MTLPNKNDGEGIRRRFMFHHYKSASMSHFDQNSSTHQTNEIIMPLPIDEDFEPSAIDELKAKLQWVAFKYEPQEPLSDGTPRKDKKPLINPATGFKASVDKPKTWGTYEAARNCAEARSLPGIGFVFTANDNYIAVDLDNCRNKDTSEIDGWAQEIIDAADTYTEVSISGTGVHLIWRGHVERATKWDPAGVEIYSDGRYFVTTEDHLAGTPDVINPAPDEALNLLYARVAEFKKKEPSKEIVRTGQGVGGRSKSKLGKSDYWDNVNNAALANISAWVKDVFPTAKFYSGTKSWRVSSKDLGRDLQEDLSIHPEGISDFGEETTNRAIDLVINYSGRDEKEAAFWLCEKLGVDPKSFGWKDLTKIESTLDDQPWPKLRPFKAELPPVKKFDADVMLPRNWRKYLLGKAHSIQTNIDHLGVFSLSVYGSLLGANVRIKPRRNTESYKVCANIWGIAVAPPSMGKSPIFDAVMAPLKDLEGREKFDHKKEIATRIEEDKVVAMKIKCLKKKAEKAFEKGNFEEGEEALKNSPPPPPPLPAEPVMHVDTTTVPALGETLRHNPLGVAVLKDELSGFFASVSGREREQDRSFFLSAYNGNQAYRYDTISRGSLYLERVCLTIAGFIQPSKIYPIVSDANSDNTNDGMIQRFQLMVMPDPITNWTYVDEREDSNAIIAFKSSFERAYLFREASKDSEIVWSFSEKAQVIFAKWLTELNNRARSETLLGALQQHLIKLEKTIAQIATIYEIAEGNHKNIHPGGRFEIGVEATERAIIWAKYLESHALRIYGSTEGLRACQGAKTIIQKRAQLHDGFNARDVYRHQWTNLKDADDANKAIDVLVDEGYLRGVKEKNSVRTDGRSKQRYFWNPGLEEFIKSQNEQAIDDPNIGDDTVTL